MFKPVAVLLTGVFLLGSSIAVAETIIVTPGDPQGWGERASNTGTIGLGVDDSQGGNGSLLLSTDGSEGQIIKVARVPLPVIRISDISSLSWEVNTNNADYYPRPNIEYWSPDMAGTLVYEAGNVTPPTDGSWLTVTGSAQDMYRDTRTGMIETLAYFQASEIASIPVNFFQIGFGSTGGTFPAVDGNVDFIELNGTTWNFEAVATLPPTPEIPSNSVPTLSQWALILMVLSLGMVAFFRRKHFS